MILKLFYLLFFILSSMILLHHSRIAYALTNASVKNSLKSHHEIKQRRNQNTNRISRNYQIVSNYYPNRTSENKRSFNHGAKQEPFYQLQPEEHHNDISHEHTSISNQNANHMSNKSYGRLEITQPPSHITVHSSWPTYSEPHFGMSRPSQLHSDSPRSAQPLSAQPLSAQPFSAQPLSAPPQSGRSHSGQPLSTESQSAQPHSGHPQSAQPQFAQSQFAQSQFSQPQSAQFYTAQPRSDSSHSTQVYSSSGHFAQPYSNSLHVTTAMPSHPSTSTDYLHSSVKRSSVQEGAPFRIQQEDDYNNSNIDSDVLTLNEDNREKNSEFRSIEIIQQADKLWELYLNLKIKFEAIEETLPQNKLIDYYQTISVALSDISDISAHLSEAISSMDVEAYDTENQEKLEQYSLELDTWRQKYNKLESTLNNGSFDEQETEQSWANLTRDETNLKKNNSDVPETSQQHNPPLAQDGEQQINDYNSHSVTDHQNAFNLEATKKQSSDNALYTDGDDENEEAIALPPIVPGSGMLSASGLDSNNTVENNLLRMEKDGVTLQQEDDDEEEIYVGATETPANNVLKNEELPLFAHPSESHSTSFTEDNTANVTKQHFNGAVEEKPEASFIELPDHHMNTIFSDDDAVRNSNDFSESNQLIREAPNVVKDNFETPVSVSSLEDLPENINDLLYHDNSNIIKQLQQENDDLFEPFPEYNVSTVVDDENRIDNDAQFLQPVFDEKENPTEHEDQADLLDIEKDEDLEKEITTTTTRMINETKPDVDSLGYFEPPVPFLNTDTSLLGLVEDNNTVAPQKEVAITSSSMKSLTHSFIVVIILTFIIFIN